MKVLLVILETALVALAADDCSSPIPFDPNALDPSDIFNSSDSLFGRATDAFCPQWFRTLWPRHANNAVMIPICFDSFDHMNRFHPILRLAVAKWVAPAILGAPGPATGHGINFVTYGGEEKGCIIDDGAGGKMWNPTIWRFALRITEGQSVPGADGANTAEATTGFSMQLDHGHYNTLQVKGYPDHVAVAHELGHVLGLKHEHQRIDRDKYMKYDCTKIQGYDKAFEEAKKKGKEHLLCTDPAVAIEFKFIGHAFTSSFPKKGDYDIKSIMHYPSDYFGTPACKENAKIDNCPMVKYKDPNDHAAGTEVILLNNIPSKLDIEWVKQHYPYVPPPPPSTQQSPHP
ncbi:hypothetical protein BCR34DRAFT_596737 [Clohesyomyces aquaticus]|uniref:Peptidase M12A domain-containing protein n=1 Tax=Clohesyomyces aquaticus TaxID=1231657 RepID=A0A1Y2A6C1_9PLEO|nr:hypothetical protein BCR34DRAFT_596737 [Clohesyomyces aquaticus]